MTSRSLRRWGWVPLVILSGGAWAQSTTIVTQPDGAEMVLVQDSGPVSLGVSQQQIARIVRTLHSSSATFFKTEQGPEQRRVPAFYIDRFEVTNEQYGRFLKANPQHRKPKFWSYPQYNAALQPVVGVGWGDALDYARWAGKRLPTEDEWEKAARGLDGRNWPWGDAANNQLYNGRWLGRFLPMRVGSFPRGNSAFGASDMAGNVWEMTSGFWDKSSHAMRGGSYLNTDAEVRVTVRWAARPDSEANGAPWLGFRCAKDAPATTTAAVPRSAAEAEKAKGR